MKKKLLMGFIVLAVLLCGCSKDSSVVNGFSDSDNDSELADSPLAYADGIASSVAVVPEGAENSEGSEKIYSESALLVDATDGVVLFQKNAHKKQYPASTTKILTSLVTLKNADTASSRTIGNEVIITEDNVVMCDYRIGDVISYDVIIHGAMMKSGNDAAAALALFAADSLENFSEMMNEEAKSLGATESNFVNPHGLYDDNHYSTAYDMYLIFNEAIKYDKFIDVLACKSFSGSFTRRTSYNEYIINAQYTNTNRYVNGERQAPSHINVIGGKSGYTEVAKRSYVMLAEANGHRYIFVTMRCEDYEQMYSDLDYLMSLIPQ